MTYSQREYESTKHLQLELENRGRNRDLLTKIKTTDLKRITELWRKKKFWRKEKSENQKY